MMDRIPRSGFWSKLLRVLTPFAVMGICLWLLAQSPKLPSFLQLLEMTAQVPPANWIAAIAATTVSFWALGRYDQVAHRHLGTGITGARARRAGMAAIAFSQTVGVGVFSGTFARWRLLPELSPLMAARLTALVALTFMGALAATCGLILMLTAPSLLAGLAGFGIVSAVLGLCAWTFLFPQGQIFGLRYQMPSLRALVALSGWTLVDITFAGLALWLLLPEGHGLTLFALLPAYFMALGLALVTSAPGGAGPLELAMLALLPQVETPPLLAGLLAFRCVYYALPALAAGLALLWPRLLMRVPSSEFDLPLGAETVDLGSRKTPALDLPEDRPQGESAVILQNGGHIQAFGLNQLALLDSPQISAALFDPLSGTPGEALPGLRAHARDRNSVACLYKCSRKVAVTARAQGWKLLKIASDAVIDPQSYSDAGSSHRQLRRKLRHAQKAGVEITRCTGNLPIGELAHVDAHWASHHGSPMGTSMGRFEAGYVERQIVFAARKDGDLIGYITLHHCTGEWALDLIRLRSETPDGTGHALIRAAIDAAKTEGVKRLSLAAVGDHRFAHRTDKGLRRFKACFAPRWEARYLAAPSWGGLILALAELIRLIHRPAPIVPVPSLKTAGSQQALHVNHEENDVAQKRLA